MTSYRLANYKEQIVGKMYHDQTHELVHELLTKYLSDLCNSIVRNISFMWSLIRNWFLSGLYKGVGHNGGELISYFMSMEFYSMFSTCDLFQQWQINQLA